jgi:hypothetical protein
LRSELESPVGVAVGVGVAVLVGVAGAVGSGVATVVSTGEGEEGVGVAVASGVGSGVAGGVASGVSGVADAVGAGVVIGVASASCGVGSGDGAWAGAATPSTAAQIAATAKPIARIRRIIGSARIRAGRGGRSLSQGDRGKARLLRRSASEGGILSRAAGVDALVRKYLSLLET